MQNLSSQGHFTNCRGSKYYQFADIQNYVYNMKSLSKNFQNALPSDFEFLRINVLIFYDILIYHLLLHNSSK